MEKKNLVLIAVFLFLSFTFISANIGFAPEIGYTCGGSPQFLVGCMGPSELSMFIGTPAAVNPIVGGAGVPSVYYVPNVSPVVSPKNAHGNLGIALLFLLIVLVIIFFIILFWIKRRKKKREQTSNPSVISQ